MPILDWIGKNKVINHHFDVPYRVLDQKYSFDKSGQHIEDNGSENMIIHGDNLEALKSLLPQYEGRIDCIYIDPPYNTGEKWLYNDNVSDPRIQKWLGNRVGIEGEDLSRHDKWLCMMYPRLKLLQKLLSKEGYIFISIQYKDESANLRLICNEIFGPDNFIGELTWESTTQPINSGSALFNLQQKVEPILLYAKNKATARRFILNKLGNGPCYPHDGIWGRCRFEIIEKSDAGSYSRSTMKFPILGQYPREGKRWQIGEATARDLERLKKVEIVDGIVKKAVYPEDELDKQSFKPFWSHLSAKEAGTAKSGKDLLNNIMGRAIGFDTVKPIELIKILLSHFDDNILVLDSFAGSATTAHAVLDMNKNDGGNRKFILIEMEDYADSITAERVKRVINGYTQDQEIILFDEEITVSNLDCGAELLAKAKEVAKEAKNKYSSVKKPIMDDGRLKVIAINKASDATPGTGGDFCYYELGDYLMNGNELNEKVSIDKIREYVYFMETKSRLAPVKDDEPYYLGTHFATAYYFYYDKENITALNRSFLSTIKTKADGYVIYADLCTLSDTELEKYHIAFKKIPRDITKL